MKPAPFRYERPTTTDELLRLLDDGPATVLAGGQSLIPLMSFRLAQPELVVDLNHVAGLDFVEVDEKGVRLGALVRHRHVLEHADALACQPLLGQALRHVGHAAVRNRGTVVGSLCHADPASELVAVAALLDATIELSSLSGNRSVPAREFFVGPLETCRRTDEVATAVRFPALPAGTRTAFLEASRRAGDYAMVGVAALTHWEGERLVAARAAYLGVEGVPPVLDLTAEAIHGDVVPNWAAAGRAAAERVAPETDIHASAEYRRHLVAVLTSRALAATATATATATDPDTATGTVTATGANR